MSKEFDIYNSLISKTEGNSADDEILNLKEQHGRETRSERISLLVTPSLKETIRQAADSHNLTMNELINLLLIDKFQDKGEG